MIAMPDEKNWCFIAQLRPGLLWNSHDMLKSILVDKDLKHGFWLAGSTVTSQSEAMLEMLI